MSRTPRLYTKSVGNIEPKLPLTSQVSTPVESDVSKNQTVESYQKKEGTKPARSFWVIISGGEKREKDYFKVLSNQERFNRIKLEFIADPNKLTPLGMFEIANILHDRFQTSRDTDTEPDKIYLISDVDDFLDELKKITPKCESYGYNLIISNSCFEVWLYYAFADKITDFPIPENSLKISGKFKGWANGVVRGGLNPIQAIFNIKVNIENARKNYQEDKDKIPKLFSTNMYSLAEDLLPHIEKELDSLIAENQKREYHYRAKKK